MRCSVNNCHSKVDFKFPSNLFVRRKWLQAIKKPKFRPLIPKDGLCKNHFSPNDIVTESAVGK